MCFCCCYSSTLEQPPQCLKETKSSFKKILKPLVFFGFLLVSWLLYIVFSCLLFSSCSHLALWGQKDVVIRPGDGTGELAEDDRFFGDWGVLLQAVVPVVHTHTHHLLRGQHRSQQLDVWPLQHTLTGRQGSEEEEDDEIDKVDLGRWLIKNRKCFMPPLFVTSVHTPDPCLPAPVAPSLSKAWRGQTPSDPPRRVPHLAPLPLWCPHCRHDDETALDASLHHSGLAAVGLLFAFEWINWRCWRSKDEVSSVKDKWSENDVRKRGRWQMSRKFDFFIWQHLGDLFFFCF